MAIKTSGPITIQDLVNEFGGTAPHSLNEYYRGGGLVPEAPINSNVPASGAISLQNFYGATNQILITYEIIGGGGGGGSGADDRNPLAGTFAPAGTSSSIKQGTTVLVSAAGGPGGENHGGAGAGGGGPGEDTVYGDGGRGNGRNNTGGSAPATSYGAGGGGGGGDRGSLFDRSGAEGLGGRAGTRRTGTLSIVPGTQLTITIGAKGAGSTSYNYGGGAGANGYCKITNAGVETEFTSSGTYTV